jgi:hypothetical protein
MKIIRIDNIKDEYTLGAEVLKEVSFFEVEQRKLVLQAANNNAEILKNWFNKLELSMIN